SSYELLSEATRLSPGNVKALMVGEGISTLAPETGAYGASEIYVGDHPDFKFYNVEKYSAAAVEAVQKSGATIFLATCSSMGRDLMPRIAARLNTGMLTECISLSVQNGKLTGRRPMYAGKCLVEATIPEALPQIATTRPNVFAVSAPDPSKKASVVSLAP